MKRPSLKFPPPTGARYKCSFPNCEKRYVSTDGVRKHARKRHTEWLAAVDEHSGLRDKTFESKPSTYCIMEYDDDEDLEGSEGGGSWRSESVPSDNESPEPNEAVCAPYAPVVAREVARAPPIGEPTRLASIAMEMNAEALMPTSLPSVPDFLRMINQIPVSLPPPAISSDDEPNTPPNTPPRSDPVYSTPWTKGLSGPGTGPPIMPFFLDEVPSKPTAAAAGWDRPERAPAAVSDVAAAERGDPGAADFEDTTLLNMAESDAFVSMLLAFA
jgi:hypothetical protein